MISSDPHAVILFSQEILHWLRKCEKIYFKLFEFSNFRWLSNPKNFALRMFGAAPPPFNSEPNHLESRNPLSFAALDRLYIRN